MVGTQSIEVSNKNIKYSVTINRKVSVIRGKGGTGKSTFVNMLLRYQNNSVSSGVKVSSSKPIRVLIGSSLWDVELKRFEHSIFVVDEGVRYIYEDRFQELARDTDNYFIFITRRDNFNCLPYAIRATYEFVGKSSSSHKIENVLVQYYKDTSSVISPDIVVTEDSKSGNIFMKSVFKCNVISGNGNSSVTAKIKDVLDKNHDYTVYVIVDGAAFGAYMSDLLSLACVFDVYVFSEESFEFIVLNTPMFKRNLLNELEHTEDYADISVYLTWEQYYTELLKNIAKSKNQSYDKKKLPKFLQSESVKETVKMLLIKDGISPDSFNK